VGRSLLLLLTACGRIGFDSSGVAPTGDSTSGGSGDGSTSAIAYVQPIVQHLGTSGASESFPLQAMHAGDAIVMMVGCAGSNAPTGVVLSAPGWVFTPLSPLTLESQAQIAGASFGAIAPDTAQATVSLSWTAANCNRGKSALADEFGGTDPTGGTTTFDAHAQAMGGGNCTTSVTTGAAGDAVWGACYAGTMVSAAGPGYTMGASDGIGDFTEYKLTADPAGTAESVTFTNPNGYVVVAVSLRSR